MAELYMKHRESCKSYTLFFKEEYLEGKRSFSSNTVSNNYLSVRRFFIWYKHRILGMDKHDFISYKYPSTHYEAADSPRYTAEEICNRTREEIEKILYSEGEKFGLINAEKCLEYERLHQDRTTVKDYFKDKIAAKPKLDYVEVIEQDVKDVTRIHISRFIDWLRDEKEVKRGTATKYKNSLKHFIKFYSHPDYCPIREDIDFEHGAIKDSLDDFKNKPSKNRDLGGKTLTPDQVEALIESRSDARDRAIILTLVKTGMRREELTNLRIKDVYLDENWIHLRHRKGGKSGSVIFDDECKRYLKRYIASKKYDAPDDYVFTHGGGNRFSPDTITKKYKDWARIAGLKENSYRGPHDLRHTFAAHHRREIRNTETGERIFRRVQMSHKDNRGTGERYDYQFNDAHVKPIEERFEDYNRAVPQYLPY